MISIIVYENRKKLEGECEWREYIYVICMNVYKIWWKMELKYTDLNELI